MITNNLLSPLWAILPNYANRIYGAHERQIEFYAKRNPEEMKGDFNCNIDINDQTTVPETFTVNEGVGVLPVMGMVIPKSDFFTIFFGGFAALDVLERDFRILMGREDVHTIVMDIDSPGGNAFGVEQFANLVFNSREKKHIISVTSGMMASAAMWIGAAAHKTFITGEVTVTGSIGTVTTHTDISELNRMMGITQTEIAAGKFKRVPSALAPLDNEGREVLQNQVDTVNAAFVGDIAKFKNVRPSAVKKMAEGKTFIGSQAIKIGLIDGLLTMGQLFDSINNKSIDNFNSFNGGQKMTLIEQIANMKTENVDLYNAMIEKGKLEAKADFDAALPDVKAVEHAKGIEAGKVTGRDEGILAERARIASLTELENAGNKELIAKYIEDGKTTAPEAAVEILKVQNKSNVTKLENLESGSPDAIDVDASAEGVVETDEEKKGLKQLVKEYQAAEKCTKGEAIIACSKKYPNAKNDFSEVVTKAKY
jgi:signal peptide peptidase SppA